MIISKHRPSFEGFLLVNIMNKVKERPMLFSTIDVQAILDGRKTMARRVLKNDVEGDNCTVIKKPSVSRINVRDPRFLQVCPHGRIGERIWVRETWQHSNFPYAQYCESCAVFYRADYKDDPHGYDGEKSPEGKYRYWNPSIHMPRSASRILLEIINVRVERLKDISEQDCIAEGFKPETTHEGDENGCWGSDYDDYTITARKKFFDLWCSIYAQKSIDENPWLYVIEFKVLEVRT